MDFEIDGGWKRGAYKKGLKHGLERKFDGPYTNVKNLRKVTLFREDHVDGKVWQCLPGGAFMLGKIDPETEEFCGKNVIYIYPDCKMAICGRFSNGTFISGYMHLIESITIPENTWIPEVEVSKEQVGPLIKRDVSTHSIIGK